MSGKTAKAIRKKVYQYKHRFLRDEWVGVLFEPIWKRVRLCLWILRGPLKNQKKIRAKTLKNT